MDFFLAPAAAAVDSAVVVAVDSAAAVAVESAAAVAVESAAAAAVGSAAAAAAQQNINVDYIIRSTFILNKNI